MGVILIMSFVLLLLFFKELKVTTFDPGLAASLGISPLIFHYGLMSVSSVTIVGAFDAVGAILVVALMIAPAAKIGRASCRERVWRWDRGWACRRRHARWPRDWSSDVCSSDLFCCSFSKS